MMKTRTIITSGMILLSVFFASSILAQPTQAGVRSGSFQLSCPDRSSLTLTLEGPQFFQETVNGTLIISNLLPGNYMVNITSGSRRGRGNFNIRQNIRIESGQRVSFTVPDNGRYTSRIYADNNSIILCIPGRQTYPDRNPAVFAPEPVNQHDFDRIINTIKRENWDDDKLNALDVASRHYFFTTQQAGIIAKLFRNDESKLACLKLLYPKVIDPENLFTLVDIFTFRSGKDAYYEFLKGRK